MANQLRHAGGDDVVRRLMHKPDRRRDGDVLRPERRDWAKLPRDLAAEIAGSLLAIDLSEYIRFRAVCKPWRRSTDDPRGVLDSRFFPRNWVMLSNYVYGSNDDPRRRLLNVATGVSIVGDFPELSGHQPLGYADGLLVLYSNANEATSGFRLFNPLTRAVTDLPDFSWSSELIKALKAVGVTSTDGGAALFFRGFGVIDGPPTVVFFLSANGRFPLVAFTRPGETRWALADTSALTCGANQVSVLSLRGRFYLASSTGDVLTVELHPEPRLVRVVRKPAPPATTAVPATSCSFYLAPSGNDDDGAGMLMIMMTVHAAGGEEAEDHRAEVEVFEVDVDGRRLVPKSTVGAGRALFIGSVRALSISTKLFRSIATSTNSVYLCHRRGLGLWENLFHVFHIDNGRVESAVELKFVKQMQERGPFFGPFNLDVYLAWCVEVVRCEGKLLRGGANAPPKK